MLSRNEVSAGGLELGLLSDFLDLTVCGVCVCVVWGRCGCVFACVFWPSGLSWAGIT